MLPSQRSNPFSWRHPEGGSRARTRANGCVSQFPGQPRRKPRRTTWPRTSGGYKLKIAPTPKGTPAPAKTASGDPKCSDPRDGYLPCHPGKVPVVAAGSGVQLVGQWEEPLPDAGGAEPSGCGDGAVG